MPCVNLGIVSFGCSQTQEMKLHNKLQQSIVQSIQNNASAVIAQSAVFSQEIDLTDAKLICGVEAKVTQKIEGKLQFVANVTNNLATDIRNVLSSALDSAVKANQESIQSLMDRAGTQASVSELVNELNASINQNITNDMMTRVAQNLATSQKINLKGATIMSPTCIIDQTIMLDVFATAIIQQASSVVLNNEIVQKIKQQVENEQSQKSGLSDLSKVLISLAIVIFIVLVFYVVAKMLR